jgi:protein-L-isoaspartate(D-aspartate) O-methyltransferase
LDAAQARLIQSLSKEIRDRRVLEAMLRVPRELFVPFESRLSAYEDRPLSIGYGQTISQPFIVALMTQALSLKETDMVLELGTGSGYQTAIIAELAQYVISTERVAQLAELAKKTLDHLGYKNIEIHVVEGSLGWQPGAPYDAIIVTAGSPDIPGVLLEQLVYGGRMVVPVGTRWEQDLLRVTKGKRTNKIENMGGCRFVPLIGDGAWNE